MRVAARCGRCSCGWRTAGRPRPSPPGRARPRRSSRSPRRPTGWPSGCSGRPGRRWTAGACAMASSMARSSSSKSAVRSTPMNCRPCSCALMRVHHEAGQRRQDGGARHVAGHGQQRDQFVRAVAQHQLEAFRQLRVRGQRRAQVVDAARPDSGSAPARPAAGRALPASPAGKPMRVFHRIELDQCRANPARRRHAWTARPGGCGWRSGLGASASCGLEFVRVWTRNGLITRTASICWSCCRSSDNR